MLCNFAKHLKKTEMIHFGQILRISRPSDSQGGVTFLGDQIFGDPYESTTFNCSKLPILQQVSFGYLPLLCSARKHSPRSSRRIPPSSLRGTVVPLAMLPSTHISHVFLFQSGRFHNTCNVQWQLNYTDARCFTKKSFMGKMYSLQVETS